MIIALLIIIALLLIQVCRYLYVIAKNQVHTETNAAKRQGALLNAIKRGSQ